MHWIFGKYVSYYTLEQMGGLKKVYSTYSLGLLLMYIYRVQRRYLLKTLTLKAGYTQEK